MSLSTKIALRKDGTKYVITPISVVRGPSQHQYGQSVRTVTVIGRVTVDGKRYLTRIEQVPYTVAKCAWGEETLHYLMSKARTDSSEEPAYKVTVHWPTERTIPTWEMS